MENNHPVFKKTFVAKLHRILIFTVCLIAGTEAIWTIFEALTNSTDAIYSVNPWYRTYVIFTGALGLLLHSTSLVPREDIFKVNDIPYMQVLSRYKF